MIDERVQKSLTRLGERFALPFSPFPVLQLDGTWPSNGTITLLLDELRKRGDRSAATSPFLEEIAAYLGRIAYDCWNAFPGISRVELRCDSDATGVTLSGEKRGRGEKASAFTVSVSSLISSIVTSDHNELPLFGQAQGFLREGQSELPVAILGLCTGLCPIGDGDWKAKKLYEATGELLATQRVLAESCASYYRRVFPHEPVGADPNLYSAYLILPPQGFDEPGPACRAVTGLFHHLHEADVPESAWPGILQHLMLFPDEHISNTAWAFAAALSDGAPTPMLEAIANAKRTHCPALRLAVMTARKLLAKPHDWVSLLRNGEKSAAIQLARREAALHLTPLLLFGDSLFEDEELHPMLEAIAWNDLESALSTANRLSKRSQITPELRLQHLYLVSLTDDANEVRKQLDALRTDWRGSATKLLELSGRLHLIGGRCQEAMCEFDRALRANTMSSEQRETLTLLLFEAALHAGDTSAARTALEGLLALHPLSVPCRLKKLELLRLAGELSDLEDEILRLGQQSPTHPEWFHFIAERKLIELGASQQ